MKKYSILYRCKDFLLSSGIQAHAVDEKTLKFDPFDLCPK